VFSRRLIRRVGILSATLALSVPLAACGSSSSGGSSSGGDDTLTVAAYSGSWGDSFSKAFVQPFEKDTGIKVKLVPGDPASWLTALRASKGGTPAYDVTAFTPNVIPAAVDAGVVDPLQTGKITQWNDLNTVLTKQSNIGGKQYGLPVTVGSTGIAYRKDKIKTPPTDWSDFFNPAYCGHVAISPLTFNTGVEFLAGLIREDGGDIQNPADVDKAFTKLQQLKKCASVFPADATSVESALQNGDAWIAAHWDGRVFVMQNNGDPVGYVYPKSGAVGALTSFFVAKNTKKQADAYKFLNYLASANYQPTFSEGTWYAASNDTNKYTAKFTSQIHSGKGAYDNFQWVDYTKLQPKLSDLQSRWQKIFG
jgi:spermidine/putrescine-binding protein